jgi:hypothetical protein
LSNRSALLIVLFLLGIGGCAGRNLASTNDTAIRLARSVPGVATIENYPGRFVWQVVMYCEARANICPRTTGDENPVAFPIRIVCYCEVHAAAPRGWYFEANLNSASAVAISGNIQLQALYDLP